MSSFAFYLVLLALFLSMSVFFSAAETAYMAVNRLRLKYKAESGDKRAEAVRKILANPDRLLGVILLGSTVANIAAASLATWLVTKYAPADNQKIIGLLVSIALAVVILVFAELTPKIISAAHAEQVSGKLLLPVRFSIQVLSPLAGLAAWIANRAVRSLGMSSAASPFAHALSEDEIRSIIAGSGAAGLADEKKEMLHNVFEIGATQVREIMIPRVEVTALEIDASVTEILATVARTSYSRIPVFRENFDNLLGTLYVKDLLQYMERPGEIVLQYLMRPVHFVPDTARLDTVLKQFQSMHLHMAGVVDEFGGVEGIVTLEDLLEEIVGEIRDEHDTTEVEAVRKLGPNLYSLAGSLPVRDFNRWFDIKIPESKDYTTVVGFLETRTGRLLKEGEIVRYQDLTFSIEKVDGFRIVSLRVRTPLLKKQAAGSGQQADSAVSPTAGRI
ncbi:MAG TPA: hemolysin family protein [Acidobacteriota bacterium]|nr:hemolysin family protein [Acidobacteriota bacterium]